MMLPSTHWAFPFLDLFIAEVTAEPFVFVAAYSSLLDAVEVLPRNSFGFRRANTSQCQKARLPTKADLRKEMIIV